MEIKKNPKADLQKYKSMFFLVGMIVSLGVVLAAFEYESKSGTVDVIEVEVAEVVEDMTEITRQEEQKPEEIKQQPKPTQQTRTGTKETTCYPPPMSVN